MRCSDVIRELAAPSVGLDSVALSAHLDQCPECAAWAERDAKLNQLWETTRPDAPSADSWDRVWARASEALDRQPGADVLPMPASSPRFGRRAVWIFGIAQAAAAAVILIMVLGPDNQGNLQNALTAQNQPAPVPIEIAQAPSSAIDAVEIDQGEFGHSVQRLVRGLHRPTSAPSTAMSNARAVQRPKGTRGRNVVMTKPQAATL